MSDMIIDLHKSKHKEKKADKIYCTGSKQQTALQFPPLPVLLPQSVIICGV